MSARVLRGTKHDIAAALACISGEVREAIVFVDEPAAPAPGAPTGDAGDIFAEMDPPMVDVGDVDDSREAIYSPWQGCQGLLAPLPRGIGDLATDPAGAGL